MNGRRYEGCPLHRFTAMATEAALVVTDGQHCSVRRSYDLCGVQRSRHAPRPPPTCLDVYRVVLQRRQRALACEWTTRCLGTIPSKGLPQPRQLRLARQSRGHWLATESESVGARPSIACGAGKARGQATAEAMESDTAQGDPSAQRRPPWRPAARLSLQSTAHQHGMAMHYAPLLLTTCCL